MFNSSRSLPFEPEADLGELGFLEVLERQDVTRVSVR